MGQKLLQSEAASTNFYFKVGQSLFQNEAGISSRERVTSVWGKLLFQGGAVISKKENYFKVGHNTYLCWYKTPACNISQKHKRIRILQIFNEKSAIPEHIKWRKEGMNIWFFSFLRLCSLSASANRWHNYSTFLKSSHYYVYTWPKKCYTGN